MSLFSTFMKWKLRWAALSGFFTLIVLPLVRWFLKRRGAKVAKTNSQVIDVQAEEVSKTTRQ
jgi:hypothetical protein